MSKPETLNPKILTKYSFTAAKGFEGNFERFIRI